jgi:hypothetical protein
LAPSRLRAGRLTAASVQVNVVDPSRAYNLEMRVNGIVAATVNLPISTLGVISTTLNVAINAGDLLTVFLVRTSGSGGSAFTEVNAMVEVNIN